MIHVFGYLRTRLVFEGGSLGPVQRYRTTSLHCVGSEFLCMCFVHVYIYVWSVYVYMFCTCVYICVERICVCVCECVLSRNDNITWECGSPGCRSPRCSCTTEAALSQHSLQHGRRCPHHEQNTSHLM